MLKKITSGYYSKMMLICITAVCTITAVLLSLCSFLIRDQEKSEYLKNYDIAVNNLSSILTTKQNSLANTLSPVFSSTSRYQALCSLYQKDYDTDYNTAQSVIRMLSEICRYDQFCRGILLITNTGKLYQYNVSYDTLVPLQFDGTAPDFTSYDLQILSDAQIDSLSSNYDKPAEHVYGLSSTIFDYSNKNLVTLGQMVILYSTAEFTNAIADAHLDERGLFSITDMQKNIIYASDGEYLDSSNLLLAGEHPVTTNSVQLPVAEFTKNGTNLFYSSIFNGKYDFYTNYQLPRSAVAGSFTLVILAILALVICLASILLYVITMRISNKKIKTIQAGMSRVGQNNLDYRLPLPNSNDEFKQITVSFNKMCDELQRNVEKAYVYEISQKKAELYAMQTSINPHFLYNALEQIRVQIVKGLYNDASQMLLLLSKMYRNQTRRNLYVSIGEELNLCENLINLYMYRFGNFEYEFCIDNALKIYGIPKNTLQPLIENYFVHGLILDRDDNMLTITVTSVQRDSKDMLELAVEDNGSSITPEELELLKEKLSQPVMKRNEDNGFALSNVNTRLKLVFGEASCLIPQAGSDGCGFRIAFYIPPVLPDDIK